MAESSRRGRVRYSDEFRQRILDKLASGSVSLRQISREFRISLPTLIKWRREAGQPEVAAAPPAPVSARSGQTEIERLREEVARLREERDRLRRGIAYLAGVKVPE